MSHSSRRFASARPAAVRDSAVCMEFELLHSTTTEVLKPLRDALKGFVLSSPLLALCTLCALPTALLYLSQRTERAIARANAALEERKTR